MTTIQIKKRSTKIIAHRGLSGLEKENTLMAFTAAGMKSYYGIECDIHKTKDGKYVVIHDDDTLRVAGKELVIKDSLFQDLRQLELLDMDNRYNKRIYQIPTLEEYLECCIKYQKICVIEFKNEFQKEDVFEVLTIINNYHYLSNCIFISFYINNLLFAKEYKAKLKCQLLIYEPLPELIDKCISHQMGIDIYYKNLTLDLFHLFKSHNLEINCWTLDDKEVANKFIELGIDYITTNILE